MVGDFLEQETPRCFSFSIQQIRLRELPTDIDPASSTAYPARSILCVVWRAIGTLFSFIPMNTGAEPMRWIVGTNLAINPYNHRPLRRRQRERLFRRHDGLLHVAFAVRRAHEGCFEL